MINIGFLIVSYFVSLFVDWIFQNNWQATNKSKWGKNDDWGKSCDALLSHSLTYSFLTTFLICFIIGNNFNVRLAFTVLFLSHAIIDSRIPVKFIMKLKGMKDEQIYDYQNYGFMHIGIDHRLHEAVLLLLSIFVS
jgi:hypothetical protein